MEKDQDDERHRLKEKQHIAALVNEEREAHFRRSYTSFGKLILAEEKASPMYSIGLANRFIESYGKAGKVKETPGPVYNQPDVTKYKYKAVNNGSIGKGKRPHLSDKEKYEYFSHLYQQKNDLSALSKKWNHIKGGGLPLDSRIKHNFRSNAPEPGRYNISLKSIKPKAPAYYIGEKIYPSSLKLQTGTNELVGPSSYRAESAKTNSRHRLFPIYSFTGAKRPGLYNINWALKETYFDYSSCGKQIFTRKRSEPIINFGKSTRTRETKRAYFPSTMERRPQSVRLPMPKI